MINLLKYLVVGSVVVKTYRVVSRKIRERLERKDVSVKTINI